MIGVGVRPRTELAEAAGLEVDKGIVVDDRLRTSDPSIWAAGDSARYPHPDAGSIRVEHWVLAQRQGQAAAANILGHDIPVHHPSLLLEPALRHPDQRHRATPPAGTRPW